MTDNGEQHYDICEDNGIDDDTDDDNGDGNHDHDHDNGDDNNDIMAIILLAHG